ncbi:hypothetical protein ACFSL6_09880 [Paenibacillus thailandensis]|uniref:Yip1 domain-containing protein n=1 Tax=Paenibacillus thailandensis TaxID=393250 RepID=A0ABW5R157_9BACL
MLLADFVKVMVAPRPVMERRLRQERFFSMILLLSLLSAVLAVTSVSFFRAEDMSRVAGIEINQDTYEAYKIFLLFGTAFMSVFSPVVFILLNSLFNKLMLFIFRVSIPLRRLFILGILAYVPMLMDTVLRIVIQLFIQRPLTESPANLFAFLVESDSQLGKTLSVFTVFGVWSMALYAVGVYMLAPERARVRSVAVVVVTWLIATIVSGLINGLPGPLSS